jgi:hypothetical protein
VFVIVEFLYGNVQSTDDETSQLLRMFQISVDITARDKREKIKKILGFGLDI